MGLGVGFSRPGVALLPVHGGGCVLVAPAGARLVSIPSDRSRKCSGYILMTSEGGDLATTGGAFGGALEGRGEDAAGGVDAAAAGVDLATAAGGVDAAAVKMSKSSSYSES